MRSYPYLLVFIFAAVPLLGSGCGQGQEGISSQALAVPGPWRIPESTLATGEMQRAPLTEGGAWVGPSGCSGDYTDGARDLAAYVLASFPGVSRTEGYACREIVGLPGQMSVHGTGRAIDIFVPTIDGEADNDIGDAVGNWLIENAEDIGIQRIIWDRWTWWSEVPAGYSRSMAYDWDGSHPHNDHLHVEMTVAGGNRETEWFSTPMTPPLPAGCVALPAEGGVVDNTDPCFQPFGSPEFWRTANAGIGGSSIWTNAFQSDTPGNWARWNVVVDTPGDFEVSVNTVAEFAVYNAVRYEVAHDGRATEQVVNQSEASEWRSLGVFRFSGSGPESVSVYDNYAAAVADDQHVSVDALRLTRMGDVPPTDAGTPDSGPNLDAGTPDAGALDAAVEPPPRDRDRGGCQAAYFGTDVWPMLLGLVALFRIRRRV